MLGRTNVGGGGKRRQRYLYHDGAMYDLVYQKIYGSTGSVNLTNSNGVLEAKTIYSSGNNALNGYYGTGNKIDVTKFNSMVVIVKQATLQTASSQYTRIGLIPVFPSGSAAMSNWGWGQCLILSGTVSSETKFTLDISEATGEFYVAIGEFAGSAVKTITLQLTDWYLE